MIFKKLKEFSGHAAGVYSLASDGRFLYSASADKYVARWDIHSGVQDKFAIKFENPVYSICLAKNSQLLIAGLSNGDMHIFDLEKKIEIKFFTQHIKAVFVIAENKLKNQFYSADADGNLAIWDAEKLSLLLYLPLDCGKIRRIGISADGNYFSIASQDGQIRVFDTLRFNEVSSIKAHKDGTTAVMFHPFDNSMLLTGGKDALLKVWKWSSSELIAEIPAHNYVIYDIISVNNGDNFITSSRDKTIKIWNTKNLSFLQRLDLKAGGHRHSVNCLTKISESTFASGSDDKRMIIWDKAE
jgi:WD40 repeat protein